MKADKLVRTLAMLLAAALLAGCAADKDEQTTTDQSAVQTTQMTDTKDPEQADTTKSPETSDDSAAPDDTDEQVDSDNVFIFTRENFPKMDGSTSLVPLGQAVASVLLGQPREDVADLAMFNRTTQSFRNLKDGVCDVLIVSEPSAVVFDEMADEGFSCEIAPIATDALIFVVNEDNPVENLTTEQIRGIYTGEITNWSEVGGADEEIVPFQRNEGAGSQALMLKLVMGDTPMAEVPVDYVAGEMGELMEVVRSYDNSANAIGYSVYYYANDMQMAEGLKLLAVDGVAPSEETIRSGEYPHLNSYYTVISADEPADSPARILYEWLQTEEGQRLVDAEGYVAVMALEN